MLKVNDYVIHINQFGLGIIVNITKDFFEVKFLNNGTKNIININGKSDYLVKLDDDMISFILNEENYSRDGYLIKKGKDYFRKGRVIDVTFTKDSIFSQVLGNHTYDVVLELEKNRIYYYHCSCPVKGLCKHSIATLFEAKRQLLALKVDKNKKIEQLNLGLEKDENLKINFDYDYKSFLDFYKALNDFKENYSDNLYGYLYALENADISNQLLEFLLTIPLLYSKTSSDTKRYCERMTNSNKLNNLCQVINKKIREEERLSYSYFRNPTDFTYKNYIINEEYYLLMDDIRGNYYKKLVDFLVEADIPKKYNLLNLFKQIFYYNTIFDNAFVYLKENLSNDEFNQMLKEIDYHNIPIKSLIKFFNKEQILEFAVSSTDKELFEHILNDYDEFIQIDKKKTIQVLIQHRNLYPKNLYKGFIKNINDEITPYLQLYLDNNFDLIEDEDHIDVEMLNKHFTFKYSTKEEYNDLAIYKKLFFCACEILSITERLFNKNLSSMNVSKENLNKINKMFEEGLNLVYGEDYQKELEEKKQSTLIRRQQIFNEQFQNNIKIFDETLSPEPIMLEESRLIDLEFNFNYISNYYSLTYRVGKDKKYVVKDVFEFAKDVFHGRYATYGKGLAFYHNIENFNPKYREPLKYSLELLDDNSKGKENRLDDYNFSRLILKLKGLNINYNNKEYLVRLDKLDYRVNIDNNYYFDDGYEKAGVVALFDYGFYFNSKEGVVDIITDTKNNTQLACFINSFKGSSIKDNVESFKEVIYTKFNHLIDVDDSLKEQFKIKDILIKANFDYNNKSITVKTEIFDEDNNKINEDELGNNCYVKYNKYLNYLSNLGFINGELKENNKILNFLAMDFTNLKKLCRVYLSESIANKKIETFNKHTIVINNNSNVMEAFVENSIYTTEELYEILKALKLKKKFVLLKGDRIVRLDNEEAEEFGDAVNLLKLDKNNVLKPKNIPIYQSIKAQANLNNIKLDEYLIEMINEISNFKNNDIPLPKLNATLRDYQKEGYRWLSILTKYNLGGILADDMGLGKTLQMIALLKANKVNKPSLIVCPKTLIFNWKSEFQKFDSEQEVVEIYGISSVREKIINNINYKSNTIYLTSYDSLRNDIELYKKEFNFLILDEAQVIKNVYASKSVAVKNIKAKHRFALTGTPVENNIIDLWSIFDFIMPDYFEELSEFKSLYNTDENFVTKVSKRIAPFILRRTKKDVLHDLPSKYEQILTVSMNDDQRKVYDAYKLEAQNVLNKGGKSFDIFPYLLKLRQICIDPCLFAENYRGTSAKLEALNEIIDEYINNGHRILIFSQFVKALDVVKKMLDNKNIEHFYLTGETNAKTRIEYTNEFNANENIKVFLISLKAGGTGLNLIGADTVIHLDPWWNQAVEEQATDRTYRIGQQKNVEVIKLICDDSIEKRVIELQNAKKDLIDKLISNDDSSITKLSLDDLKYILKE